MAYDRSLLALVEDTERENFIADGACAFDLEGDGEPYFVLMPPPNVTGPLHLGHGLSLILQDTLVRHRRLQGYNVFFPPGTDHGGARMENVVQRQLRQRKLEPRALGRERMLDYVQTYANEYRALIVQQMKMLSIAANWDHEWFSMDEERSRVLKETFVELVERDVIYRAEAVTNWCPALNMPFPGDGIECTEEDGLKYLLRLEHPTGPVELSVIRLEFLLAATAIGIQPEHPAFERLRGTTIALPLVDRLVPIIAVGARSGMGRGEAILVVPSASGLDYELAQQGMLSVPELYASDGTIAVGPHACGGLDIEVCRRQLAEQLEAAGKIIRTASTKVQRANPIGFDGVLVVPRVTAQWYLRVHGLAEDELKRLGENAVKLNARTWELGYRYWLRRYLQIPGQMRGLWWDGGDLKTSRGFSNIRDWLVSSQSLWGQRMPVWDCVSCARPTVSTTPVARCKACGATHLRESDDVMQLTFSGSVWPRSVSVWPERPALADLTVTGHDVYLYWIATSNMVCGEVEDKAAYKNVHVHGLIVDDQGAKMTKSSGNTVSLAELCAQEGVEVVRAYIYYGLAGSKEGEAWVRLGPDLLERARATVFGLLEALMGLPLRAGDEGGDEADGEPTLDALQASIDADLEIGRVGIAYGRLLDHLDRVRSKDGGVAARSLDRFLGMLHPFHPLLSDHIFRTRLKGSKTLLLAARRRRSTPAHAPA
ncbi:class I tRNA ligase family protein [Sorangium sp. So ce281]|uniref:class I tRNA ligase family protein n=1 Tax=unclassified Sorangium TaxID=2621164 RepID=UPI003F60EF16